MGMNEAGVDSFLLTFHKDTVSVILEEKEVMAFTFSSNCRSNPYLLFIILIAIRCTISQVLMFQIMLSCSEEFAWSWRDVNMITLNLDRGSRVEERDQSIVIQGTTLDRYYIMHVSFTLSCGCGSSSRR